MRSLVGYASLVANNNCYSSQREQTYQSIRKRRVSIRLCSCPGFIAIIFFVVMIIVLMIIVLILIVLIIIVLSIMLIIVIVAIFIFMFVIIVLL